MKKYPFLTALIFLFCFSCNPYEKYSSSYYYVQAEIDPAEERLSVNVQMVLVAGRDYRDSIRFDLNPGFEILTLTAQELEQYIFNKNNSGKLVLYIEELVAAGDELHISMSYSGKLPAGGSGILSQETTWLPENPDTRKNRFEAKIALPGGWVLKSPESIIGKHGKWQIRSEEIGSVPDLVFERWTKN